MLTFAQYWTEVATLAKQCLEEAEASNRDLSEVIGETVDGHPWIIYYSHNLSVLAHTDHLDAAEDMVGLETIAKGHDTLGMLAYLACCAMLEDVSERASRSE